MTKRLFLGGSLAALGAGAFAVFGRGREAGAAPAERFELMRSEAEWRQILTPAQYRVLREEGTEPAGSSPLNAEKRAGLFHCAGCDLPVYSSATKYESGTGWPSFWESLPDAVRTKEDRSFFMRRTEVHCRRCGGHFGHIFDDGPPPTGKRHCLNGLALTFVPGATEPAAG
ncbi:peptide-methionine (R)-S-oxide reductase MsrB [Faunimonas sp. B44]|uniref:peptide-methionine (R)-S-oxide reductase MsrB n=1 Tax=Faunimonas sp. B44 TaxID=3461493 RepID=UPI004045120F